MPSEAERSTAVRAITPEDIDGVVAFALRAWAPGFASFKEVLGSAVYELVYSDWLDSQATAVGDVCQGPHVWVGNAGSTSGRLHRGRNER